jgi:lysophospholipase L1-like esterase
LKARATPVKNAFFSFLFLLTLFFAVEGVLRFFVFGSSAIGIWGFNPYGLGDLRGGIDAVVRIRPEFPYRLVTDEEGLRTCDLKDKAPKETRFRILGVGDSITFGPYVDNEFTYPCLLEKALNEGSSGQPIEVLNAGIPGYTVTDEHRYLLEKGLRLNPQVVLLGIHTNDPTDLSPGSRARHGRPVHLGRFQKAIFYMRRLAWYELAVRARYAALAWWKGLADGRPAGAGRGKWLAPSEQDWRTYWSAYRSHLKGLIGLLRERRVPLLVILFPDPAQVEGRSSAELQRALMETLSEEGVPFVDLPPA